MNIIGNTPENNINSIVTRVETALREIAADKNPNYIVYVSDEYEPNSVLGIDISVDTKKEESMTTFEENVLSIISEAKRGLEDIDISRGGYSVMEHRGIYSFTGKLEIHQ